MHKHWTPEQQAEFQAWVEELRAAGEDDGLCPEHPEQPAIHCACTYGKALTSEECLRIIVQPFGEAAS